MGEGTSLPPEKDPVFSTPSPGDCEKHQKCKEISKLMVERLSRWTGARRGDSTQTQVSSRLVLKAYVCSA